MFRDHQKQQDTDDKQDIKDIMLENEVFISRLEHEIDTFEHAIELAQDRLSPSAVEEINNLIKTNNDSITEMIAYNRKLKRQFAKKDQAIHTFYTPLFGHLLI